MYYLVDGQITTEQPPNTYVIAGVLLQRHGKYDRFVGIAFDDLEDIRSYLAGIEEELMQDDTLTEVFRQHLEREAEVLRQFLAESGQQGQGR